MTPDERAAEACRCLACVPYGADRECRRAAIIEAQRVAVAEEKDACISAAEYWAIGGRYRSAADAIRHHP